MRVAADSHALLFYLFTPDQLSDAALEALGDAEDTDGIVVSAATLGDLWYASHKAGERGLAPGAFDSLRSTILNPDTQFEIATLDATTMDRLASFPLARLPDPWDREKARYFGRQKLGSSVATTTTTTRELDTPRGGWPG